MIILGQLNATVFKYYRALMYWDASRVSIIMANWIVSRNGDRKQIFNHLQRNICRPMNRFSINVLVMNYFGNDFLEWHISFINKTSKNINTKFTEYHFPEMTIGDFTSQRLSNVKIIYVTLSTVDNVDDKTKGMAIQMSHSQVCWIPQTNLFSYENVISICYQWKCNKHLYIIYSSAFYLWNHA